MWRRWEQPIPRDGKSGDDFEEESDDYDTKDYKQKDSNDDSDVFKIKSLIKSSTV